MNYRWFSQSLVICAYGIHLHVHQQPQDHREKEKKNKIKVTHKNKEQKKINYLYCFNQWQRREDTSVSRSI